MVEYGHCGKPVFHECRLGVAVVFLMQFVGRLVSLFVSDVSNDVRSPNSRSCCLVFV